MKKSVRKEMVELALAYGLIERGQKISRKEFCQQMDFSNLFLCDKECSKEFSKEFIEEYIEVLYHEAEQERIKKNEYWYELQNLKEKIPAELLKKIMEEYNNITTHERFIQNFKNKVD